MLTLLNRTYTLEYFDLKILATVLDLERRSDNTIIYHTRVADKHFVFKKTVGLNDCAEIENVAKPPKEITNQLSEIFSTLERQLESAA